MVDSDMRVLKKSVYRFLRSYGSYLLLQALSSTWWKGFGLHGYGHLSLMFWTLYSLLGWSCVSWLLRLANQDLKCSHYFSSCIVASSLLSYKLWNMGTPKMEPYPYRILFGYSYSWGIFACVPKFFNQKKSFSFIFSFGYVTKIDKSSKNDGNMNFSSNYIDVHFFYLLFWILICNLKTI